jgi:hypothetical protein
MIAGNSFDASTPTINLRSCRSRPTAMEWHGQERLAETTRRSIA